MMRKIPTVLGAMVLTALMVQPAGAVVVNVEGYQGEPLPGLTLSFSNDKTGAVKTVETDPFGQIHLITDSKDSMRSGPNMVELTQGRWSCSLYREDELLANQSSCINVAQNGKLSIRNIEPVRASNDPAALAKFAFEGKVPSDGTSSSINWKVDVPSNYGETSLDRFGGGLTSGGGDASDHN